jgi:hypothetical protein
LQATGLGLTASVLVAGWLAPATEAGPLPAPRQCGPACGPPTWDPQLGWTYSRHPNRLRWQGQGDLRYHQHHYPYDRAEHLRRTYPHTYRGQFGLEPEAPRLNGRFWSGPGYSPFNSAEPPPVLEPVTPADPAAEAPPGMVQAPALPPRRLDPVPDRARGGRELLEASRPSPDRALSRRRGGDFDHAWTLLADGHAERSQYAFASLALGRPSDGLPKAGFALAVALQDDHPTAAFLLRRALKVDAPALRDVPMTDALRRQATRLLALYEEAGGAHRLSATDTLLMSAVLHYLLGRPDAARGAAVAAVELGDRDPSIFVLLTLLHASDEADPLDGRPREPRPRTDLLALGPADAAAPPGPQPALP